jgi:hypothetical protein
MECIAGSFIAISFFFSALNFRAVEVFYIHRRGQRLQKLVGLADECEY